MIRIGLRSGLKTIGLQTNAIRTLLIALLTTSAIQAQTTTNAPPAPLTVRHFDPRIQYGIDLIYSLKFAQAEAFFDSVMIAEPDNPVGYFFRAMTPGGEY